MDIEEYSPVASLVVDKKKEKDLNILLLMFTVINGICPMAT